MFVLSDVDILRDIDIDHDTICHTDDFAIKKIQKIIDNSLQIEAFSKNQIYLVDTLHIINGGIKIIY